MSTTRRHGRLKISASTSSAGQRSSTPKPGQTTKDDTLRTVTTLLLRIIYSTDWIEHTTNRQIAQQQKHRDTKTVRSTGTESTNSVGIRSEPISRMTANIRYSTTKSGGESSGILSFIPDYVRYAADRIKMKGS